VLELPGDVPVASGFKEKGERTLQPSASPSAREEVLRSFIPFIIGLLEGESPLLIEGQPEELAPL
jgi:hypothetical protein